MSARFKTLPPLMDEQALAADPAAHASLSASAGTGKTQVLTARVLRLLLKGTRPESILCLTFTKAAAAEMANRIGTRLAAWVRLKRSELWSDLEALGEVPDDRLIERARQI
jgi:ATP-dependent helicase/nuclease subunit A